MCRTSAAIVIKERGKDQQQGRHPTYCDVCGRSIRDPHAPEICSAVGAIRSERSDQYHTSEKVVIQYKCVNRAKVNSCITKDLYPQVIQLDNK